MSDSAYPALVVNLQEEKRRRRKVAIWLALSWIWLVSTGCCVISQPVLGPKTTGSPQGVDPVRLEAHVRKLSQELVPRDWTHPENLDRAAAYIKAQMVEAGARVSEQTFAIRGKEYRNVIGRFGPEAGARVVLGAHYDAFDELPGADDNASGVAGVLELARLLGKQPPSCPVELVAYTLEEPPFFGSQQMGSAHHAQELRKQGVVVKAALVLEMIGYFSDARGSQHYPLSLMGFFYPSRGNFIAVVGHMGSIGLTRKVKKAMKAATDLPVWSLNAPRFIPGVDFSDHHPYWDVGYPAVMVSDSAFNRNKAYHSSGDTPDRLDYLRMAKVVEGTLQAVRSLERQ